MEGGRSRIPVPRCLTKLGGAAVASGLGRQSKSNSWEAKIGKHSHVQSKFLGLRRLTKTPMILAPRYIVDPTICFSQIVFQRCGQRFIGLLLKTSETLPI